MNEQTTPAALARAFTEAWTHHDVEAAAGYLTVDVTFDSPTSHSDGKDAYIQGLSAFAPAVTGAKILAAFGDDTQALIMYEVTTSPFGTLTCAELLTFREGKIAADVLTFDTFPIRGRTAGDQPSDPAPSGSAQERE